MHVFPAAIPAAEVHRTDLVEARVARKVASLFGLGGDLDPFRRSWVCDYTALSLTEIGRGAPKPDRAERSRLAAEPPRRPADQEPSGWSWSGRAVWCPQDGALPGALSNATLNRYGPDTKAAVVLAAANRLLRDSTAALAAVARQLVGTGCDVEVRVAVWAGLVLEVYRAQPALVVAAIQAREVQRSLSARWGGQVDRAGVAGVDAPSEIHTWSRPGDTGREMPADRWRPVSFDLVDATLPALGLADDTAAGPGWVTADALDDIASAWCHRLLGVGRPGRGVVWLSEDGDGSRRVHAMVRVGAVVAPFVATALGGTRAGGGTLPPALPVLPDAAELAGLPLLSRRAQLLAAHVACSYVRYRDELLLAWPQLRAQTRELVDTAVLRCAGVLDSADPVPQQLRAYADYLGVWDLSRSAGHATHRGAGAAAAVQRLVASQEQLVAAWRAARLDPGAVAYLLEIGIVALGDAAASRPPGSWLSIGGEERLGAAVRGWWSAILRARGLSGVDNCTEFDSLADSQIFHLHHYAAWLARGRQRGRLRRALALQERVAAVRVEVARREPAAFAAKSAAARAGHELAAEIATELALATPEREHRARAGAVQAAVGHARAVLADPSTDLLHRAGPRPETVRAARVVARALSLAAGGAVGVAADDAAAALSLIECATGDGVPGGWRPEKAMLAALRAWRKELARPVPGVPAGRTSAGAARIRPGKDSHRG